MGTELKIIQARLSPNKDLLAIRVENKDGCQYEGILKKRIGGELVN